jgi:HEAT repeat protein
MSAKETIQKIIELDEQIAELRESLEETPVEEQEKELVSRFDEMLESTTQDGMISVAMIRVAEMLLGLESEGAIRSLGSGLGHANEDVRMISGDAFLHIASEGLEKVMPVIDDALEKGGLIAEEIPFLLMDADLPEATDVLIRFLDQKDPEIVASAIEALAELGDPAAVPALNKFSKDERTVTAEADGTEQAKWTIGQLCEEAIEMLSDKED